MLQVYVIVIGVLDGFSVTVQLLWCSECFKHVAMQLFRCSVWLLFIGTHMLGFLDCCHIFIYFIYLADILLCSR